MKQRRWTPSLASLLVLAACGGAPQPVNHVTTVTVAGPSEPAKAGNAVTLTADVVGTGAFDKRVTWSIVSGGGHLTPAMTVRNRPLSTVSPTADAAAASVVYTSPWALSTPGSAVIRATSVGDPRQTQDFTLPLAPPRPVSETEPNDTLAQANPLQYGDQASGEISSSGDQDFYSFSGQAGDFVTISVTTPISASGPPELDAALGLIGLDGKAIAASYFYSSFDTYSGDPVIQYLLPATGTYTAMAFAESFNPSQPGGSGHGYTIRLAKHPPLWQLRAIGGSLRNQAVDGTRSALGCVYAELTDLNSAPFGPSGMFGATVAGPSAWNGGQLVTSQVYLGGSEGSLTFAPAQDLTPSSSVAGQPAAQFSAGKYRAFTAGQYTLNLDAFGTPVTAPFSIDPATALPTPANLRMTSTSLTNGPKISWDPVPGASSYEVAFGQGNRMFIRYLRWTQTSLSIQVASNEMAGQSYWVEVRANNYIFLKDAYDTGRTADSSETLISFVATK